MFIPIPSSNVTTTYHLYFCSYVSYVHLSWSPFSLDFCLKLWFKHLPKTLPKLVFCHPCSLSRMRSNKATNCLSSVRNHSVTDFIWSRWLNGPKILGPQFSTCSFKWLIPRGSDIRTNIRKASENESLVRRIFLLHNFLHSYSAGQWSMLDCNLSILCPNFSSSKHWIKKFCMSVSSLWSAEEESSPRDAPFLPSSVAHSSAVAVICHCSTWWTVALVRTPLRLSADAAAENGKWEMAKINRNQQATEWTRRTTIMVIISWRGHRHFVPLLIFGRAGCVEMDDGAGGDEERRCSFCCPLAASLLSWAACTSLWHRMRSSPTPPSLGEMGIKCLSRACTQTRDLW